MQPDVQPTVEAIDNPLAPSTAVRYFLASYASYRPFEPSYRTTFAGEALSTLTLAQPHRGADQISLLPLLITAPQSAEPLHDCPVMVFIHGGSYESGHFREPVFEAAALAEQGFIVVSVEYRLAIEGFVRFSGEKDYRGIEDCREAIGWVADNIERFGGDPTNITVVGHSAGAGIALWLGRKDHYDGTFRRILAVSPAFPRRPFRKNLLRACLRVPLTKSSLLNLAPSRLKKGAQRFSRLVASDLAFGPYPFEPAEMADLPIIISCTDGEMFDLKEKPFIPGSILRRIFGMPQSYEPDGPLLGSLVGDTMIRQWALGIGQVRPKDTWLIDYQGDPPIIHGADLRWVFGSAPNPPIFNIVKDYLRGVLPSWPDYSANRQVLIAPIGREPYPESDPYGQLRVTLGL
ncbi:alpha/beta fold hydrolase [Corynebacterium sp. ES2715-CONJ3]|uniref:alpha/beta fold hydrolase n=1 Tax=Corynebacterium sp. ES2715-CONJ3 TaxID=2974028 RepID=UPI002168E8BB|nr:alpha/beta fold hydrolase [Corynebacterium sp. ES2715-CONJ3]MCS4492339.1 alpha/beta fold hydrolase [Corynebacterium sp. ES2715-CONJ3]